MTSVEIRKVVISYMFWMKQDKKSENVVVLTGASGYWFAHGYPNL